MHALPSTCLRWCISLFNTSRSSESAHTLFAFLPCGPMWRRFHCTVHSLASRTLLVHQAAHHIGHWQLRGMVPEPYLA